jgi:hypothetical protein
MDTEGERGFLTERDKEFLRGEREYSGDHKRQMTYQVRRAIRERTQEACRDFTLLLETLDPDEVATIFAAGSDAPDGVYKGMGDALSLFFASFFDRKDVSDRAAHTMVDMLVKRGVEGALEARRRELKSYQSVRFNEEPSIEELERRFLAGKSLTYENFQRLQAEGSIEGDLRHEVEISHFTANRENADVVIDDQPAEEYFDDTDASAE